MLSLASFAVLISENKQCDYYWPHNDHFIFFIPSDTTQGRLRCYCKDCMITLSFNRFIPHSIAFATVDLSNSDGPPRLMGQRLHAFVDRPKTLTPSISPGLGAPSQHKKLHRYALWQIFRPAFRIGGLTRILHHPLYILSIA